MSTLPDIDYSVSTRSLGASPMDYDAAQRLALLEDLLPVVSNPSAVVSPRSSLTTLGKAPSMYDNHRRVVGLKNWTERKTRLAMVEAWKREADYGICIQTRRLRALDIDIKDAALSRAIVAAVCGQLGITSIPLRYRVGTGKCLLVFWLLADEDGDFYKRSFKVASGEAVEFLATGEQFVAVATHPSGTRYHWGDLDCLPDADEIPRLTRGEFERLWSSLIAQFAVPDSANKSNVAMRSEVAKDAIKRDPIAQKFIEDGMVRGYRADGGMNVHCPQESLHSGDSGATEATYWPAFTGGFSHGGFMCQHDHCRETFKISHVRKLFALSDGKQPIEPKRFNLLNVVEVLSQPSPSWLIKGVLPRAGLIAAYGEPGSGKSAFVLDMVVALVNGTEWCGRRVEQCRVLCIVAEGAGGFRNRIEALDKARSIDRTRLLTLLDAPNLSDEKQVRELATMINAREGTDLIVVDTLSQTTPGANENSGEDMGPVIENCRMLHEITGATITLIGHSGKDATKGLRGWSGMFAALDAAIEITRNGDQRVARIAKMRDGDDNARFPFKLKKRVIGYDADGDEKTSITVEHSRDVPVVATPKPKGATQEIIYKSLTEAQRTTDTGRVPVKSLIDAAMQFMVRDSTESKRDRRRQLATRALEALADRGVVIVQDDYVWPA